MQWTRPFFSSIFCVCVSVRAAHVFTYVQEMWCDIFMYFYVFLCIDSCGERARVFTILSNSCVAAVAAAAAAAFSFVQWKSSPLTFRFPWNFRFFFLLTWTSICWGRKKKHGSLNRTSLILNDGSDNFHRRRTRLLKSNRLSPRLFDLNQFGVIESSLKWLSWFDCFLASARC